jgi:1-carboxybiuret hydrolase subunit AtzG-like protein
MYAEEAAAAIGLPLPAHCKAGVVANLTRLAAMVDVLLAPPPEVEQRTPP